MTEESKKRSTTITSASLSEYFRNLMNEYGFSPTECMRRGIAVMACDAGAIKYQTEINRSRSLEVKEFFDSLEELEILKGKLIKLKELLERI